MTYIREFFFSVYLKVKKNLSSDKNIRFCREVDAQSFDKKICFEISRIHGDN